MRLDDIRHFTTTGIHGGNENSAAGNQDGLITDSAAIFGEFHQCVGERGAIHSADGTDIDDFSSLCARIDELYACNARAGRALEALQMVGFFSLVTIISFSLGCLLF